MVITMQDYDEIRKRFLNGESQRHIAKTMGISRNTVKKYCEGNAVPWERKTPERSSTVLNAETVSFIKDCLASDAEEGLKKQKHTAKRIYDRLVSEKGFSGGESTVRAMVHELKAALPQVFVPLAFDAGEAMQVDWGEAVVYLDDVRTTINIFCSRLCYSCRPIILAYHKQNEESFLDAFVRTFEEYGGVPSKVIFDNGKVAVKEGFGAHARKQKGYTALSAHYGFEAIFCNPAEGHEKGLVEGLVGWARRNILVPVPRVRDISELNRLLLARCSTYEQHRIKSKPASVGDMYSSEQTFLRKLPGYPFETAKSINARVNAFSTVRFRTNSYSVPVQYAGNMVGVKGYPETVQIFFEGKCIATHTRCFGRNQSIYHLEHYLPLLEKRGRAILDAAPVKQNVPPEVLDELRKYSGNTVKMMQVLREFTEEAPARIQDQVKIKVVDLHQYDQLCIGGEVNDIEYSISG
ncbi:MAG: IS21 family transposase [Firmicutes bacterium]|nr:IS21 family transposase [Bacillota bacterium]